MTTEPKLEQRAAQPYAAIRAQVPMQELGTVVPLSDEVLAWLRQRGVTPAGAPFFRYLVVDMQRELELELGWPVAQPLPGDERVVTGELPAGRYAVLVHTGHPDTLVDATAALLAWAEASGLRWQMADDGQTWAARLEFYLSDPEQEPDMNRWQTELAFLVAPS